MAFCEYSRDFMLCDVTPVENLFLLELMPHAPGDYVRVYLYGLMLCRYPAEDSSAETIAHALGLKPDEVTDAFRYWERAGLVMRLSDKPPRYQYLPARNAVMADQDPENGAYRYKEYFAALQEIFGADKLLGPQEQGKAVEWVETLRLPEEIALKMVRWQVEKARGTKRSLRYLFRDLDALAMRWAEQDIRTAEAADSWILSESEAGQVARVVLRHMGQRRGASLEELEMARGWVNVLHQNEQTIEEVCRRVFARATSPSFAYLDSVLSGEANGSAIPRFEEIRKVLSALGAGGQPTPAQSEIYASLLALGFNEEAILFAAGKCSEGNRRTFDALRQTLESWKKRGMMTADQAREYFRKREPARKLLGEIFEAMGQTAELKAGDITIVDQWMNVFPNDVILYAASRSANSLKPFPYMQKILTGWQEKGVTDLASAKREAESMPQTQAHTGSAAQVKQNPARSYSQREYDDEKLRSIAIDFTKLPGGDAK